MNTKRKYTSVFTAITFSILLSGGLFPFMEAQAGGGFTVDPSGETALEFEGHCYAFIPSFPVWINAFNDAPTKSVNGNPGHLVSITSAAEDAHVDSVSPGVGWIGYTSDTNFHQPATPIDGDGFAWITAEATGYTGWNAGEPNNVLEMYVTTHDFGPGWNDAGDNGIAGYFVEFDSCHFVGGESLSVDSTALVLAGLQSSAIWMLPVLAGIASTAFGVLYYTNRRN